MLDRAEQVERLKEHVARLQEHNERLRGRTEKAGAQQAEWLKLKQRIGHLEEHNDRLQKSADHTEQLKQQVDRLREHNEQLRDRMKRAEAQQAEWLKLKQRIGHLEEHNDRLQKSADHTEQLKQQVDRLREHNEQLRDRMKRAEAQQVEPPAGEVPKFFVAGRGRSGTTWLMRVLDAHPEVVCKGEGRLFDAGFQHEELWELHPGTQGTSLYNALVRSERLRRWVERSVWTRRDRATAEEHLDNLMALSVDYFLGRKLALEGPSKRIVGDKTPFSGSMTFLEESAGSPGDYGPEQNGAVMLDEISRVLPGSKVIDVVRDGRDVAVSVMHFLWSRSRDEGWIYELSQEELRKRAAYREGSLGGESIFTEKRLVALARGWAADVGRSVRRGPEVLGDGYLEVRYEELAADPEREVARVLAFLGVDASGAREALEEASAETGRAVERDGSGVQFRHGVAGGWREVFTEEDRRIFEEHAAETLARLGYEVDC